MEICILDNAFMFLPCLVITATAERPKVLPCVRPVSASGRRLLAKCEPVAAEGKSIEQRDNRDSAVDGARAYWLQRRSAESEGGNASRLFGDAGVALCGLGTALVGAPRYSLPPDVPDPLVGNSGVDHCVGDRAMAHEGLQRPCIDSTSR